MKPTTATSTDERPASCCSAWINLSNRRMRTRLYGGVGGESVVRPPPIPIDIYGSLPKKLQNVSRQAHEEFPMGEYESLSQSKWECKYHIIFIPKCRRKTL